MSLPTAGGEEPFTAEEQAAWNAQFGPDDGVPAPTAEPTGNAPAAPEPPEAKPAQATQPEPPSPNGAAKPEGDNEPADDALYDQDGKPNNKGKFVRYGALHQERERRKALEGQLGEKSQVLARLDERLRVYNEAQRQLAEQRAAEANKPPAEPDDPRPDPEQDVIGYSKWLERQLGKSQRLIEEQIGIAAQQTESVAEQQRQAAAAEQLRYAYDDDANRFSATTPDFWAAYKHVLAARASMLQRQGYDPVAIKQIIQNEERDLVTRAFAQGQSPAAWVYDYARTFGYRPPEPQAQPAGDGAAASATPAATAQPNAGAAAPAAAKPQPNVSAEIERLQRGQQASRSLSNAGGSPGSALTASDLIKMSDKDFDKLLRKNPELVNALMGADSD